MPAEYYVRIKDQSNNVIGYIDDFYNLGYQKRVWEPGLLNFVLSGDHPKISLLATNNWLEVWRRNTDLGVNWYVDFNALVRGEKRETKGNIDYYTAIAPGQATRLSWYRILYPDQTANRSIFTAVNSETLMKALVTYNATTAGWTGDGREVSVPYSVVSIETDTSRGSVIDWKCAHLNLLDQLQAICKATGNDFDVVQVGSVWQFKFYPVSRGTDRSATVLFSTNNGNMAEPSYTLDKTAETTIAVVGGRGLQANRSVQVVTGNNYNASTNYIEDFVNAAESDTVSYLTSKGKEQLYATQARNKLTFQVLQTPACSYGLHYFLGDLVKAYYKGISFTQKVFGITVNYSPSGAKLETINIEMRDA